METAVICVSFSVLRYAPITCQAFVTWFAYAACLHLYLRTVVYLVVNVDCYAWHVYHTLTQCRIIQRVYVHHAHHRTRRRLGPHCAKWHVFFSSFLFPPLDVAESLIALTVSITNQTFNESVFSAHIQLLTAIFCSPRITTQTLWTLIVHDDRAIVYVAHNTNYMRVSTMNAQIRSSIGLDKSPTSQPPIWRGPPTFPTQAHMTPVAAQPDSPRTPKPNTTNQHPYHTCLSSSAYRTDLSSNPDTISDQSSDDEFPSPMSFYYTSLPFRPNCIYSSDPPERRLRSTSLLHFQSPSSSPANALSTTSVPHQQSCQFVYSTPCKSQFYTLRPATHTQSVR